MTSVSISFLIFKLWLVVVLPLLGLLWRYNQIMDVRKLSTIPHIKIVQKGCCFCPTTRRIWKGIVIQWRGPELLATVCMQRNLETMQKQKRRTRRRNPSSFVSKPLALHLCAWNQFHQAQVSSYSAHRSHQPWHSLFPESAADPLLCFLTLR